MLTSRGAALLDTVSDSPFEEVAGCGPGRDEVKGVREYDVGRDCERVQRIASRKDRNRLTGAQVFAQPRVVTVSPSAAAGTEHTPRA